MKLLVAVAALLMAAGVADAQGMRQQMSPPWADYSPTFPTYRQAPTIGGFQDGSRAIRRIPNGDELPDSSPYRSRGSNALLR